MIEIDIKRLVTRSGFIAAFWEILHERKSTGAPGATQISVYHELEDVFEARVGEPRFPSYDAFRKYRQRKTRKEERQITSTTNIKV